MKYRVTLEGEVTEVDVTIEAGGALVVRLEGEDVTAHVVPGGVSVRLGARMFDVAAAGKPDAMTVACGAARGIASVESDRVRARGAGKSKHAEGKELRAPMPGRVVRVLVAVGDEVEANQPLCVMEAMKMENELRAPSAGKIASVEAREGTSVEGGALLVTLA